MNYIEAKTRYLQAKKIFEAAELKYSTMRAAKAGDVLTVRGEVVRLARQVAYLETAIRDAEGEPVSTGTGTFFVRRKEDRPPKEEAS